jgi:hypothetical protein
VLFGEKCASGRESAVENLNVFRGKLRHSGSAKDLPGSSLASSVSKSISTSGSIILHDTFLYCHASILRCRSLCAPIRAAPFSEYYTTALTSPRNRRDCSLWCCARAMQSARSPSSVVSPRAPPPPPPELGGGWVATAFTDNVTEVVGEVPAPFEHARV